MKILVYGINFSPELTSTGKYTGEMSQWLQSSGHELRVITAPPYYPEWNIHEGYSNWLYRKENSNGLYIYRCPLFVPKKLSTSKRLLHLLTFAVSSFFPLLAQLFWKPDIIICIAPTLFCAPAALFFAKISGSTSVLHVQDYEVDAMMGLGMAKKRYFSKIGLNFEKKCITNFDVVSSISLSMLKKAIDKGVDKRKLLYFPNWAEIGRFENIDSDSIKQVISNLGLFLDGTEKIILYSGNIGEKQGLEILINAAKYFEEKKIVFLIVGEGGGKEKLENLCKVNGVKNIIFRPLQPYELLPALLSLADCHLIIQRKGAADSVMPSKLTNILAVGGNLVITAEENTELGRLCSSYPGIATIVEPESLQDLIDGIGESLILPKYNSIARKYAEENLDKDAILTKFIEQINIRNQKL